MKLRWLLVPGLLALQVACGKAFGQALPEGFSLHEAASALTDEECVQLCLKYGDTDHDGKLSSPEFLELSLISLTATRDGRRQQFADWEARHRGLPAATLAAARQEQARAEARYLEERARYTPLAASSFARFDTDGNGFLDAHELGEGCHTLAHEQPSSAPRP